MKGKNKKKRTLDSYGMGSGRTGTVKSYIPNPAEVLAENSVNQAKAQYEGATNPLVVGLQTAGNLAMQYGLSKGGFETGPGGEAKPSQLGGAANSLLPILGNMQFGMGGTTGQSRVNVEGEEVGQTPDGQVGEFKGPKHEGGGIDIDLPDGTKIFSDRIKVANKTMAERKMSRERKIEKLNKRLEKNPLDKMLQGSIDRTMETNQIEEQKDMMIQEFAKSLEDIMGGVQQSFATGGITGDPIKPPKWMTGGIDMDAFDGYLSKYSAEKPDFNIDNLEDRMQLQTDLGVDPDGMIGPKTFEAMSNKKFNITAPQTIQGESFKPNFTMPEMQMGDMDFTFKGASKDNQGPKSSMGVTAGDAVGYLGTAVSALGPLSQTLKARAEDTPNINAFKDFGNDALDANDQAMDYVAGQRENALGDLELSRNALVKRGRNSARGVNQMRALDLAADQQVSRAMNDIYDSFSKQMMSLYGQKAGLENQQDGAVMQGEQRRDLADRQDKDNHRTNMAQNIGNIGTALQKTGKDINTAISNEEFMELLPALNARGVGLQKDSKGWFFTDANGNKEYIRK